MLAQASCRVIGVPYNSAVQSRSALPVTPARCSLVLTPLRCHRARQITAPRVRRSLAIVQASSAIAAPVPSQYGYFMASVAFTAAVLQWMVFKVAAARKAAGVKYPAMTSYDRTPEAAAFNCTQRAHHNTLESTPTLLVIQLLIAQVYPIMAAAIGAIWAVGRIVYMAGYSSGDPSKRLPGSIISNLTQLGALVFLAWLGVSIIRA